MRNKGFPDTLPTMLSALKKWLFGPRDAGALGEGLAAEYLARQGFRLVARNWRSPRDRRDELDLVMRDDEVLVFVEVKTRSAAALVPGYHAVDKRKRTALRRAAEAYLAGLPADKKPRTFRLDVVEVTLGGAEPEVRHFSNIPLFAKNYRVTD